MKKILTADFETTTDVNDCRVWAWGVSEVGNPDYFHYGNCIETFFLYLKKSYNSTFYFHNLKFDGEFIISYLFKNGFTHVKDRKDEATKTFTTLISDTGQWYSLKIIFKKQGKRTDYVTIYDSLKLLPFSVEMIAKAFGLPIKKLELDYTTNREIGHELTLEEIAYLRNDVDIVARALHVLFEQGLTKMTQASNALHDYKATVGLKNFERWFPAPAYDKDVRQSYKGGFTYLKPEYKEIDILTGLVLDVNSLYPWVLHDCLLPYGEGLYFDGQYQQDELYPLYVQMITCQFEVKKGYIPTIQLKGNMSFVPTQYLESSADADGVLQEVTMCLTSVDLDLFLEHYNVYNLVYHSGWKFKGTIGLFTDYIDKWIKVKNESTLNGNKAMRTLAKLMLNALYGKFGLNPNVRSKIPYHENGEVKFHYDEWDTREPLYIPVATFVTAWARNKTIRSAQMLKEHFVYSDTDSLHIRLDLPQELLELSEHELEMLTTEDLRKYGINLPKEFIIDPVALGAWKIEGTFHRARFIRQKCYIEDSNPPEVWNDPERYNKELLNITCAGMPDRCYPYVTWDNFHCGMTYKGKLMPKHVEGGIVLVDTEYTIKRG